MQKYCFRNFYLSINGSAIRFLVRRVRISLGAESLLRVPSDFVLVVVGPTNLWPSKIVPLYERAATSCAMAGTAPHPGVADQRLLIGPHAIALSRSIIDARASGCRPGIRAGYRARRRHSESLTRGGVGPPEGSLARTPAVHRRGEQ